MFLGQGTAHPVCKLAGFVDLASQDPLDQIVIGDRVSVAEGHGSDLRIKDRTRGVADQPVEYFNVLTGRMKNLYAIVCGDEIQEWTDVQILGQGVNQAFDVG